jgi:hypothetical protein
MGAERLFYRNEQMRNRVTARGAEDEAVLAMVCGMSPIPSLAPEDAW